MAAGCPVQFAGENDAPGRYVQVQPHPCHGLKEEYW